MSVVDLQPSDPIRSVAALTRSPAESARLATFAVLWVFVLTIPTASMVVVSEGAGTLSRAVGLVAVPAALLAIALGGRRRRWLDVHVLMVGLVIWAALSRFWTLDAAATDERVMTLTQLVVLLLLVWEFGGDGDRWRALLWAFVLGAGIASLQLLQAVAAGSELYRGRYSAGGFNPNDLVQILAVALPIAGYLGMTAATGLRRSVAWSFLPLGMAAIVLTGSRQGLLVLPAALAIVPLALPRLTRRARIGTVAGLGLLTVLLLGLVPDDTFERLSTVPTELTAGDLGGRTELWSAAIDAAQAHPVTGVGEGALESVIAREVGYPAGAHNTYLSITGELGTVGLTLLLLGLAAALVHARGYPRTERLLSWTLGAVLLISLVPGHNEHDKSTWFALAVLVAPAAWNATTWTVAERLRRGERPGPAGIVGRSG